MKLRRACGDTPPDAPIDQRPAEGRWSTGALGGMSPQARRSFTLMGTSGRSVSAAAWKLLPLGAPGVQAASSTPYKCSPDFTASIEPIQAWYHRVSNSMSVFAMRLYMRMSFLESLPARTEGLHWNLRMGPSIRV